MKNKHLLLMLLMAVFAPLAMNAQTKSSLTVYDQNTTTNEYVPIYGYYCDEKSKVEFIIPADKLSDMNGGIVSAMKFYLASSSSSNNISATFNVFVKEVNATTLTGFTGTTNATIVYSSTISIATNQSNIELNIPFSSNYVYGGGNLLVGVYQTGNTSYNHTYWTGENQSGNTAWQAYGSSSGSGRSFLPKTTFTYEIITTPTINLPATATVLTGFTETLTATTLNVIGTPTITYTSSNTSVATVTGSGTSATVTGVSAGTATITATMTYNSNTYTAQCAITVEDPSYCTPNPTSRDGQGITTLTFGSGDYVVNNSNSSGLPASAPYYADYTSMVGGYEAGETATVTITYSTGSSTVYSYGTLIWVDWNKNYTFEDSEIVYTGTSAQGSGGTPQVLTATFTVPATQAADDYRMRIAGADSYFDSYIGGSSTANHDPCFTSTYAVCHDYTLRVVATGAYTITCATTTGGTITADKNNADENDVVTITATPEGEYLLTALTYTPEGGSTQNIDITNMPYTFTMPAANVTVNATFTLSACPSPTNLTVSNLAASHATVSWDSEAGNYTVKYSTATIDGSTLDPIFEDGFENGLGSWTTYAMGYDDPVYNWIQYDGTLVDEGNHNGDYVAASRSWTSSGGDQSVDNWLVTPQMTLGDVVKFWVACNDGYRDSYAVYVSTGSNVVTSSTSIGDFVLVKSYAEATGTWTEIPVDISAYAGQQGYVAIRHTNYGGDHIMVDDFGVFNTINTYSYGGWTTVSPNPTTESCQLTGLSAETLYEVQVQANCGGTDGSSAWSTIRFTTPDNCGAPQELASSNVTATSATLSWADDKDSYNLQYRKVYFYEDFEGSDGIPTGWTTINNSSTAGSLNWQVLHLTNHSGNNSVGSGSYIYQNTGITPDNWLISPQLDLQGTLRVWLTGYGDRYSEHFEILLSTTGTSVSDFTTTLVAESTTTNSYVEYTADLSSYTGKGYIAIHHFNCSDQNYLCVDDFGIYGSENWVALNPNPTTETANLTGLSMNTTYEWQVRGVNCDGNGGTTEWSAVATFTTLDVPDVLVESITVTPDEIYPTVGATYSIVFTVLPADATNPAVTFSSSDEDVATVDENGTVTAVAAGTATITIAATDGSGVTGTLTVNVMNIDVEEITAQDITIITSGTATINYQVLPEQATDKSVTFTSANTAIATVDADGVVTGVGVGETTITIASVQNPEVTTDITVTVISNPNAAQFTLNVDKTVAAPGDVITVEAYLNAPTVGTYNGFTGLALGLHFDPTAFAVNGDPVKGSVANACTMAMTALPNDAHPDLVQCSCVMPVGSPNTTTGLVFTVQFTVLTEVEFGSYTFFAEPTAANNFVYNPDMSIGPSNIPYEYVPSTVEVGNFYTKVITAYNETEEKGWYLIASPLADEVNLSDVAGLTNGTFRLYSFNQGAELEWQYYAGTNNPFSLLVNGKGYLYANTNDVTLTFTGVPYNGEGNVTLSLTEGAEFAGWNLVGNPFAEDAYIEKSFYRMNDDRTDLITEPTTGAIHAMEGVFVIADENGEILTFTTSEPNKGANLALNVGKGRSVIDRAIVSFNEGGALPKFQLNPNHTKVYIPQDGKDFAVVRSRNSGEVTVNFEPAEDDIYSISINAENLIVRSLILTDKVERVDIDMLRTPSYQFKASKTDPADRFVLSYKTGSKLFQEEANVRSEFGFFNNGSLMIDNEGEATLQVIDMNGHVLSSETISGNASIYVDAAPGVYMLRLINGDNVKVQKIVIK